jgi:DNA-binding SARP family transcriptional activator
VEFRILGPIEVADSDRLVPLSGAGQRALLAMLLLHANEVVSVDRLLDALWPEKPPSGTAALQMRVSHLRKALGPAGRIQHDYGVTYRVTLSQLIKLDTGVTLQPDVFKLADNQPTLHDQHLHGHRRSHPQRAYGAPGRP